jgi:ribosomal-protein-alanine N-acetyltransferase
LPYRNNSIPIAGILLVIFPLLIFQKQITMMLLSSSRLDLIALSYEQLLLLSQGFNTLEKHMGLTLSDFELNAPNSFLQEFFAIIPGYIIPNVTKHPEVYYWYTNWIIVERSRRLIVGGIGVNGLPDVEGQAMIGYFIDKKSEGKGYASEAVRYFSEWIFTRPDSKTIVADTLVEGRGSQRVLQKSGFVLAGETEEGLRWVLKRSGRAE